MKRNSELIVHSSVEWRRAEGLDKRRTCRSSLFEALLFEAASSTQPFSVFKFIISNPSITAYSEDEKQVLKKKAAASISVDAAACTAMISSDAAAYSSADIYIYIYHRDAFPRRDLLYSHGEAVPFNLHRTCGRSGGQ